MTAALAAWVAASWDALPGTMLVLAPLICVLAYVIYGLTGFGSTLLSGPSYVHMLPLRMILPLQVSLDLVATVLLGTKVWRTVRWREVLLIGPFMLIGVMVGVKVLVDVPERWLILAFGLFVLYNGVYGLRPGRIPRRLAAAWVAPLGIATGAAGAMFGAGGPIIVVYLASRIHDKEEMRATIMATIFFNGGGRVVAFWIAGFFAQPGLLFLALWLMPSLLIGLWIGNSLHDRLPTAQIRRAIYVILILAGISLIVRSLGSAA